MSRLSVFLDRRLPDWRHPLQSPLSALAMARWARFAGPSHMVRLPRTLALEAESFDAYDSRVRPTRVASGEALLAETLRAPCMWPLAAPEPVPDQSRMVMIEGVRQPAFAHDPAVFRQTRQAYLRVRSAIVYPRPGLVMTEPGRVLRNDLWRWMPDHRLTPGFVEFVNDRLMARRGKLYPRGRVRRTVLTLCHAYHRNYGHWLFDCLPFLLPWRVFIQQDRLAVLVPPLAHWQRRTLELLGVPASAVIETTKPSLICDDVIVPRLWPAEFEPTPQPKNDRLTQPAASAVEVIRMLRAKLHSSLSVDQPELIYVSRRGLQSFRSMRNEDEIEAAMMRLGFAILRPHELTLDEQLVIFARARVIAGPHGAGLTNAVFAPEGCLVVDICLEGWGDHWMLRLARMFGHRYLPLEYAPDPEYSRPLPDSPIAGLNAVYTVEPDALVAIVNSEMRKLGIVRAASGKATA